MRMEGRAALITGAGRGIGRATALHFAREGADLVLTSEVSEEIEAVAAEVRALGRKASPLVADLRNEAEIEPMVKAAIGALGRIDALVCSAGVAIHHEVVKLTTEEWDHNFDVNVRGMFLVVRALLPHYLERSSGTIVNISSKLGKEGSALRAAYAASKHAVIGFTFSLALELKPHGIRVNAICPGPVATPLRAKNYPNEDPATITSPEDVARVILYLSCDDSMAINGAVIDVAWKGQDIPPTIQGR
ncbi:MAG TPA: SDR family oxidoreductase [Candidatus Methylomirabilis sp.]|nr:SDR family oxidoreductase [Candidatus Methylomirabilis sp.]